MIFSVGVLYGTTSVAVGHPFDTIKTKMQAQRGFESEGMVRSFVKTVKTQGIRGLYRLAVMIVNFFVNLEFIYLYKFLTFHELICTYSETYIKRTPSGNAVVSTQYRVSV